MSEKLQDKSNDELVAMIEGSWDAFCKRGAVNELIRRSEKQRARSKKKTKSPRVIKIDPQCKYILLFGKDCVDAEVLDVADRLEEWWHGPDVFFMTNSDVKLVKVRDGSEIVPPILHNNYDSLSPAQIAEATENAIETLSGEKT